MWVEDGHGLGCVRKFEPHRTKSAVFVKETAHQCTLDEAQTCIITKFAGGS
jgi:hypothetical protein